MWEQKRRRPHKSNVDAIDIDFYQLPNFISFQKDTNIDLGSVITLADS